MVGRHTCSLPGSAPIYIRRRKALCFLTIFVSTANGRTPFSYHLYPAPGGILTWEQHLALVTDWVTFLFASHHLTSHLSSLSDLISSAHWCLSLMSSLLSQINNKNNPKISKSSHSFLCPCIRRTRQVRTRGVMRAICGLAWWHGARLRCATLAPRFSSLRACPLSDNK